jgi:hypothetical protein
MTWMNYFNARRFGEPQFESAISNALAANRNRNGKVDTASREV